MSISQTSTYDRISSESPFSLSWMVTFSDLIILLLTLFVLRLSMSSFVVEKKFPEPPISTLQISESNVSAGTPTGTIADGNGQTLGKTETPHEAGAAKPFLAKEPGSARRLLALNLHDGAFFNEGDELTFAGKEQILSIAKAASDNRETLVIEAYVDGSLVNNSSFPSPWDLAAARAIVILRQLIDAGVEEQSLSAVGYGHTIPAERIQNTWIGHHNTGGAVLIWRNAE